MLFFVLIASVFALSYDVNQIVGYGARATGGGSAAVTRVTTHDQLATALSASGAQVILITSSISFGSNSRISAEVHDKTIVGSAGVKLTSTDQTQSGSGILTLKSGSNNVIIRNLIFEGPGAYDCDGHDLLSNDGATNVWVNHCEFYDGVDGNYDNTHSSDNITISWCKFGYKKAAKPGGSGGSDDHRFTNLVGGSDSDYPSDGHFSITFQFCYWSDGCRERMPRARNAQLHILNCLYNTGVSSSTAIGLSAGSQGTTVFVEGTNFQKVGTVLKATYGGSPSCTFSNCLNGASNVGSSVSKPSYSYSAISASEVSSAITGSCGAGATVKVDSNGKVSC